jgi:hypothetical protein
MQLKGSVIKIFKYGKREMERKKVRKWKENQTSGRLQISGEVRSQGL